MQVKLLKEVCHLISDFHCGNEMMDEYFQCKATDDDDAVTYCFLEDDLKTIIALSSLSCNGIITTSASKISTYPAVEIKMFAVNDSYKGACIPDGDGEHYSAWCFDRTIAIIMQFTENHCGAGRTFLYSVPNAEKFYRRRGMELFTEYMHPDDRPYLDGCIPMFMLL